jgi:integrase
MAGARRDRGDGSLRRRPNGSWEGRFSYYNDEGKRVTKSVYATTQTEAKRKLKNLILNIDNFAKEDKKKPNDILVGEWLDTWMKEYKKSSIRPATYSSYHSCIEQHIRPVLGNMELQKVRPQHIQSLLNDMGQDTKEHKAFAPWTILKAKNVLSGAFEQALRNELIVTNPVKAAVSPKLEQKEIRILSEAEQQQFLDACKGHRLEALYTLALATGMRRGEILSLKWENVNFRTNEISVKSSVSRIKDPDTGKTELIVSEPKTKSGRRSVPILDNLIPVLQEHKKRQSEEKSRAGSAWNEDNLVFCSNVGTIIEPRRVCTTMDKIADAAGMEHFTFHAMRHTFATRMLEAEVPAKVVQDILGHSDVTLTLNTYSHVMGSTAHQQIAKINNLFTSSTLKQKPGNIKHKLTAAKEQVKSETVEPKKPKSKTEPDR